MDINIYIVVGIALITMFFGYFFGLFEGRGQGYEKRKKEEAEGGVTEAPETGPEAGVEPPVVTPSESQPTPGAAELPAVPPPPQPSLMRISQDPEGRLQLELNDEPVQTTAITPDQRKRLIALLTAMRPWLEGSQAAPSAPHPAPVPAPGPATPAQAPVSLPVGIPVATDEIITAPQSIVAQIDAILQIRMTGTDLQHAGIKLQESQEGGVLVWVGLDKYQSVEEVPDGTIKAAIRAAIVEWENRFTPGIKG